MTSAVDAEGKSKPKSGRVAVWVGRVISGLLAALLIMSAVMKLTASEQAVEGMAALGLPNQMLFPLAVVELTCVVLYLIPPTAVMGAILLTGYMGGTICTHWRVGDPFVQQTIIAILVWLGMALREPRLWSLIPWRRSPPNAD